MSQVIDSSLGVEEVMDIFALALLSDVNEALGVVYERRALRDIELANAKGVEYRAIGYDEIPAQHIHVGNLPSLAFDEVPKEEYPYIALTFEDYAPDPEDARLDHMNVYRHGIVAHAFAAASDEEGSEIVFRRASRIAEAVFICLASNAKTSRLISGVSNPVRGRPSVPWRYKHQGRGASWWFQAVGTQYAIKSYTSMHQ